MARGHREETDEHRGSASGERAAQPEDGETGVGTMRRVSGRNNTSYGKDTVSKDGHATHKDAEVSRQVEHHVDAAAAEEATRFDREKRVASLVLRSGSLTARGGRMFALTGCKQWRTALMECRLQADAAQHEHMMLVVLPAREILQRRWVGAAGFLSAIDVLELSATSSFCLQVLAAQRSEALSQMARNTRTAVAHAAWRAESWSRK